MKIPIECGVPTWRILASVALLSWLAGCRLTSGALTPQAAALRHVESSPTTVGPVELISTRAWDRGIVVLYRATQQSQLGGAPIAVFGYQLVERRANGWWSIGGGGGSSRDLDAPDRFVTSGVGSGASDDGSAFTIVNGEVLAPGVEAVEVAFADGRVLRDDTTDAVYAVTVAETTAACELRVLGAQDQVLETIALPAAGVNATRCTE